MKRYLAVLSLLAATAFTSVPALAVYPTPTKLVVDFYLSGFGSFGGIGGFSDTAAPDQLVDMPVTSPREIVKNTPTILVGSNELSGTTDPFQLVDMTVTSPGGAVKLVGRTVASSTGGFSFFEGGVPSSPVAAGDTLTLVLGDNPAWTYAIVLPRLVITGSNLATGTISGRVVPRQKYVHFLISGVRVVADAVNVAKVIDASWTTPPVGKKTGLDGRFTVKPAMSSGSWSGTLRRNDQYLIRTVMPLVDGDPNFAANVLTMGMVPGFYETFIGSSFALLSGPMFRTYTARLVSPARTLKGTAVASTGVLGPFGILDFRAANDRPGIIRSGDSIQVAGAAGFAEKVPRLKGVIHPLSNNATILGMPNKFVNVRFSLFDPATGAAISPGPAEVWVKTDATGKTMVSPGGAFSLNVGDWVDLVYLDPHGNIWGATYRALL